jgi:3-hydroxy acid dehydrogenase / malonic semialdehyde reductase
MDKIVFITGASSGFGAACAHKFAAAGYNLILNGRRVERLKDLEKKLKKEYSISCQLLPFDVRDNAAVEASVNSLPAEWQAIDILINNAGLAAGRGLFQDALIDDFETMIDTNVKGLLYVTKAVLPFMQQRKKGHIINLGSIAAKDIYERGNVYCGTKAAVDAISHGMRIDLLPFHIKVTAIHPGAAETEFSLVRFKGDAEAAKKIYENYVPLSAADIADIIFYTASLPAHVCINDLVVSPTQQADGIYFHKDGIV